MNKVLPRTYLVGFSQIYMPGLEEYLRDTDQTEFLETLNQARAEHISDGAALCSFYAKLCYKSLVEGKNANVTKIRNIMQNFESIINSKHGAVTEHFQINFITANCSRIYTHEQVRHRVGTAYSQTSGRYVALGVDQNENPVDINMVVDPILAPVEDILRDGVNYLMGKIREARRVLDIKNKSFERKKKLTSALRRFAPDGQANEMGWSLNLRSARHIIEQRSSRHAEWEIRIIVNQAAEIIQTMWPELLYGGKKEWVENAWEWSNLRV